MSGEGITSSHVAGGAGSGLPAVRPVEQPVHVGRHEPRQRQQQDQSAGRSAPTTPAPAAESLPQPPDLAHATPARRRAAPPCRPPIPPAPPAPPRRGPPGPARWSSGRREPPPLRRRVPAAPLGASSPSSAGRSDNDLAVHVLRLLRAAVVGRPVPSPRSRPRRRRRPVRHRMSYARTLGEDAGCADARIVVVAAGDVPGRPRLRPGGFRVGRRLERRPPAAASVVGLLARLWSRSAASSVGPPSVTAGVPARRSPTAESASAGGGAGIRNTPRQALHWMRDPSCRVILARLRWYAFSQCGQVTS